MFALRAVSRLVADDPVARHERPVRSSLQSMFAHAQNEIAYCNEKRKERKCETLRNPENRYCRLPFRFSRLHFQTRSLSRPAPFCLVLVSFAHEH